MDPLSVSASIIAILQMTGNVVQYINGVRGSPTERERFLTELNGINIILLQIQDPVEEAEQAAEPGEAARWSETLQSLSQPNGPLKQLEQVLRTLESKLAPACGARGIKNALTWPFQKEEVKELIATIERQKTLLNLARQNDHLILSKAIKDDVEKIGKGVAELQISEKLHEIHRWLSAPDPSINHHAAIKKRSFQTGSWFTESQDFSRWKIDPSSYLWLYGIPGCGKTILSSTIIENVRRTCLHRPGTQLAYYYFNFNESPQCETMLRSVLMQLSRFNEDLSQPLTSLYSSFQNGMHQPTMDSLLSVLRQTVEASGETFVILDALDECENRDELLDSFSNIGTWKINNLHLLVTSRKESDIDECVSGFVADDRKISIQSELVSSDIRAFVRDSLQTNRKLRRWQKDLDIQQDIEATLTDKADGMFRWAACQLDLLGGCLTKHSLRQALKSLPQDLDSTYDRILGKIREEYQGTALRILQWLAYAARPLRLVEIAEVVAVDASKNPRFDAEKRLQNPWDVLAICPDLLTTVTLEPFSDDDEDEDTSSRLTDSEDDLVEVRFAHFSVKEYLKSSRIQKGDARFYSIREVQAHTAIAETCITYLLQFDQLNLPSKEDFKKFPLADYAAEFWAKHTKVSEDETRMALPMGLEMLSSKTFALLNSVRICKRRDDFDYRLISENDQTMLNLPLYYASAHGLFYSVVSLLERGADVNANDWIVGSALQLAAYEHQHDIVRLLLERGADANANAVGSEYGTALQAACRAGDLEIAQLLLDNGADVNAPRAGRFGSALGAAFNPIDDHDSTACGLIRLLVRHGAHIRSAQKRRIWEFFSRDFCRELGIDDGVLDQWSEDDEEDEAFGSEYEAFGSEDEVFGSGDE